MTRLINADALKKHIFTVYQGNGVELEPIEVVPLCEIDNAPTVEPERPQGDLISREALKEYARKLMCEKDFWTKIHLELFENIIDNAPTVDLSAKWAEAHSTGYDVGYTKGLEDARPKGTNNG